MVEYGKYNMEAIYPDCLTPAYPLCHLYYRGMFSTLFIKHNKGELLKKTDFCSFLFAFVMSVHHMQFVTKLNFLQPA